MKRICDIIRDLLPLYVSQSCSENTNKTVERHLKKCNCCRESIHSLNDDYQNQLIYKKFPIKATKHFSKKAVEWICFGLFCATTLATVILWSLDQQGCFIDFETEHYPGVSTIIYSDGATTEWNTITDWQHMDNTNDKTDYFEYRHLLAKQKVNCHNTWPGEIELRFLDEDGNVAVKPITLEPGTEVSINNIKLFKKYTVQYRCAEEGHYALNFI